MMISPQGSHKKVSKKQKKPKKMHTCNLTFRDMQRLNLAKNELNIIPHEALAELNYLEHLELSENPISEIKPGDFNGTLI